MPLVNSKGLIVGRKGTVGKVYYSRVPFFCIDTAYYILPDEDNYNLDYFYYLLQTLGLQELNEDSAVPGLNRETAYNQEFYLPEISEQKAIANVLSSLDDKIDLLHRQNKTLEAMAETLFRQWFIEEAQDYWEEGRLGDLFEISSGKGLKKDRSDEMGIYPVFGANGEIGRTNDFLFEEKLIFTGRVGTLGNVFIVNNEKVWLSDNTLVFRKIKHFYLVYFILKTARLSDYNAGSTQPLIRQSDINEIPIFLPSLDVINFFETQAKDYFKKIGFNKKQLIVLEKLRDTLLPKLMSGEVRVKAAN